MLKRGSFSGLQLFRRQSLTIGLILIRLAVTGYQIRKIPRNSAIKYRTRIRRYSRSVQVIQDLGVNRKRIRDFSLVTNSNFGHISPTVFKILVDV